MEEKYSLTDQIRRSSRSVCSNIVEAWRKRRYEKQFVNSLIISEGEAAETQNWLDFAYACHYVEEEMYSNLTEKYNKVLGMLVRMSIESKRWTFQTKNK